MKFKDLVENLNMFIKSHPETADYKLLTFIEGELYENVAYPEIKDVLYDPILDEYHSISWTSEEEFKKLSMFKAQKVIIL